MELPFWEQQADLFTARQGGSGEICGVVTDMVLSLYHFWSSLPPTERATAKLRLHDRSLLDAAEIAALADRRDFPFA